MNNLMKNKIIVFAIFIVTLSTISFSQSEKVAVLPFNIEGIEGNYKNTITEFVQSAFLKHSTYTVVERNQIQKILNEQKFQETGLTENAVTIGKLLSVNFVVVGNLSKIKDKFTFIVKLIDVTTGNIVKSEKKSAEVSFKNVDDILIDPIVQLMFSTKQRSGFTILIKKCVGLVKMDALSDTDAWVQILIGNKSVGRTKVIQNDNNPNFNERVTVKEYSNEQIFFYVLDKDITADRLIGIVSLSKPETGSYAIIDNSDGQSFERGRLEVVFE